MEYSSKLIGERIRRERKRKGWNQYALLMNLNRSPEARRTVISWEKGKTLPPLDDMVNMCKLFNCELGYLLGEFPDRHRATTDICAETGLTTAAVEWLQLWKKISSKTRAYSREEIALRFINDLICFSHVEDLAEEAISFQQCLGQSIESLQSFIGPERKSAEMDLGRDGVMEDNIDSVLYYEYRAKELFGEFMEDLVGHSKLALRDLELKYKELFEG